MMKYKFNCILFLGLIFSCIQLPAQKDVSNTDRVYIKIEIKGLACPYCAYGMEKELLKIAGVENVDIELKEGLAYISTPLLQKPTKEDLKKVVEDAGFTAGEVAFQEKPFKRNKSKRKK